MTIQKLFQYTVERKFDSLRKIAPSSFSKDSSEDLRIDFKEFREIARTQGIPSLNSFKLMSSDRNHILYRLKFTPEHPGKVGVDSIIFNFNRHIGVEKVWTFEVFDRFTQIRTQ
jgi:hypothetical protein